MWDSRLGRDGAKLDVGLDVDPVGVFERAVVPSGADGRGRTALAGALGDHGVGASAGSTCTLRVKRHQEKSPALLPDACEARTFSACYFHCAAMSGTQAHEIATISSPHVSMTKVTMLPKRRIDKSVACQ